MDQGVAPERHEEIPEWSKILENEPAHPIDVPEVSLSEMEPGVESALEEISSEIEESIPDWLQDSMRISAAGEISEKESGIDIGAEPEYDIEKELADLTSSPTHTEIFPEEGNISPSMGESATLPTDSDEITPPFIQELPVEETVQGYEFNIEEELISENQTTPEEELELPEWMQNVLEDVQVSTLGTEKKETESHEGIPEWMKEETGEPEVEELKELDTNLVEEISGKPDFKNINAAIDWLENMTSAHEEQPPIDNQEIDINFEIPEVEEEIGNFGIEIETEESELIEETPISAKAEKPSPSKWILESAAEEELPTPHKQSYAFRSQIPIPITREGFHPSGKKKLININKASLTILEQLPGMGFRIAQNIINYRQTHGEFKNMNDLRKIPKINPDLLETIAPLISFSDQPQSQMSDIDKTDFLTQARHALSQQDISAALVGYNHLIQENIAIPEVVADLAQAVIDFPFVISLWQALGDAYLKADRLEEALETYRKAEEIVD